MKIDKQGKMWARTATLVFSHVFAIGLGEIWVSTGEIALAPPWWAMCVIAIGGMFFGGIWIFSEEEEN